MGPMPDFSLAATFDGLLPEEVEEMILDHFPGSAIRHTDDGDTEVAVLASPRDTDTILDAARAAGSVVPWLAHLAGTEPRSFEVSPLDD